MQDEVNEKTIALCITGGKITVQLLKQAMNHFLNSMEKQKIHRERRHDKKEVADKNYRGKQSMKQLAKQNVQLSNIEITDQNIKAFERVAKRYGIDFSLKRDNTTSPPRYFVFFKARDVDVMETAFREFTGKTVKKEKKPSVREKLKEKIVSINKNKHRERQRTRQRQKEHTR